MFDPKYYHKYHIMCYLHMCFITYEILNIFSIRLTSFESSRIY
jgi:hypothetical protein